MNIQRFTAPTSREALAKARAVFGDGTLILSNRPVPGGVEVVATAEDALDALAQEPPAAPAPTAARAARPAKAAPAPSPEQQDAEQLAMSTLSFQDYVRERMLRRRHEAAQASQAARDAVTEGSAALLAAALPPVVVPPLTDDAPERLPAPARRAAPRAEPTRPTVAAALAEAGPLPEIAFPEEEAASEAVSVRAESIAVRAEAPSVRAELPSVRAEPPSVRAEPVEALRQAQGERVGTQGQQEVTYASESAVRTEPSSARAEPATARAEPPTVRAEPVEAPLAPQSAPALTQNIVNELQAMKALIDDRFNTLAWLGETRQDPIRASLMHKLIRAGYSPTLSRTLLEHLPEGNAGDSLRWLTATLERNLRTDAPGQRLLEEGGVFALVGATGVGKTTTVAKLAGLAVREHGSAAVGMITLDTQRVGAHEQLRTFGRQMGVVAHQAHDRAALAELLNLFANRHLVLIDTAGLAPGDARMRGMLDMLDLPGVNRTLVLNAGSHGDTLDNVLSAFRGTGTQHAILSKLDEAVKLGPALDTLIRHQFTLRGVTNGQRVPEDWLNASAADLVRQSMRAPARSAFDPRPADLGFFFAEGNAQWPAEPIAA